jgi:hypothetical protein
MYLYSASSTAGQPGDAFTAQAQGDLNGDGVLSLYPLTGSITSSYALFTAPNFVVVRPDD